MPQFRRNKPHVHLELPSTPYEPGDVVEGRVVLSLPKPVRGAVLTAALQCQEQVEYRDIDAVRNYFEHTVSFDKIALSRVNTTFAAGDHEFPVKWTLPATMPVHTTIKTVLATLTISTSVCIVLQRTGKIRPSFVAVFSVPVIVPESKESGGVPVVTEKAVQGSSTLQLKATRKAAAGCCTIDAHLASDVVDQTKSLVGHVTIRNTATHGLRGLFVELRRTEHLTTPIHRMSQACILPRWDLTDVLVLAAASLPAPINDTLVTDIPFTLAPSHFTLNYADRDLHFLKATFALQLTCELTNSATVSVMLPVQGPTRYATNDATLLPSEQKDWL